MSGTSNFVAWDAPQVNIESDTQYAADSSRINGLATGAIVPSPLLNKVLLQATIMPAAIGEALAAKGFSTSDSSQSALAAVLANLITTADQPATLQLVPYSPTVSLNAANVSGFYIELTGNCAIQAITGLTAGQLVVIFYAQDATGGRLVTFPSNMSSAIAPNTTANAVSMQVFRYDPYTEQLRPAGPLVSPQSMAYSGLSLVTPQPGPILYAAQSGPTYSSTPSTAAIYAYTQGAPASNYLFSGSANGTITFSVRADGLTDVGALQVAGAATSGAVLIGNGTSFIPRARAINVVTTSRSFGTTYTNNSAGDMYISGYAVTSSGPVAGLVAVVDGASGVWANTCTATVANGQAGFAFLVPAGGTYALNSSGAISSIGYWAEYVWV
jgi:hypothetical protein